MESIQGYHEKTTKRLSSTDELVLMEAIVRQPSIYLYELQNILLQTTGTTICLAAIHNFLTYQGFTHKKLSHRALQRSDQLRENFLSEISLYEPHMLIFVDETGSDRRTVLRKYGYSLKGKPATTDTLLVRGKRYSAIAAMSLDGIVDVHITSESVNGDTFYEFIERNLLPQMLPFDGINGRSVVVMDNASIHHT